MLPTQPSTNSVPFWRSATRAWPTLCAAFMGMLAFFGGDMSPRPGCVSHHTADGRSGFSVRLGTPAFARNNRFRTARKLFRKANRYAQRRAYKRAIDLFKRIVRLLRGRTARDQRGRWEAIFRIAVLYERMKQWLSARQVLENLWRIAPSPRDRYRSRLRERFAALSSHVKPELIVFVQPIQAQVILKYQGKPIPVKGQMQLNNGFRYTYDVPVGRVVLIVKKLGYQPRFQTIQMGPARAKSTTIKIERLTGTEYPAALLRAAQKHYDMRRYKKARRQLTQATQTISPAMSTNPEGATLQFRANVLTAKLDVIFGRSQQARRRIAYLWRKHPGRQELLRRELCPLQRRYRYSPSLLPQAARCSGRIGAVTKPPPASSGKPSAATWVLWGSSVVGVIVGVGIYFGATEPTRARRDQDPPLPSAMRQKLHEEYNTYFALTWVALSIGIVAGVGGTLLYFLKDRKTPGQTRQAIDHAAPSEQQPVKQVKLLLRAE